MSTWITIPTKPFSEGKRRLLNLKEPERVDLNRWLFQRTLQCALQIVPGDRIVVVSRSAEAVDIARQHRANTVRESATDGLNGCLTRAARFARNAGATVVVSVSCDLPLLDVTDLEMLLRGSVLQPPHVVIATDRSGEGTNALAVAASGSFRYQYGPDSCARHNREAERIGAIPRILTAQGLAFDLDTAADYEDWQRLPASAQDIRSPSVGLSASRT